MATKVLTATVQTGKASGTNSNFPAYVDLSELPAAFWDNVSNGGGDIRVYTDSALTTEIAREVVSCTTADDKGELWAKVGSMTSTTTLYIKVDGTSTEPAASATYGKNNVWSDYAGVWHLNEASGNAVDAKGVNTLTDTNTVGTGTGKIAVGRDGVRANNEYFEIADGSQTGLDITGDISINAWLKADDYNSVTHSIASKDKSSSPESRGWWFFNNAVARMTFYFFSSNTFPGGISEAYCTGLASGDVGNFLKWDAVVDVSGGGGGIAIYKNGSAQSMTVAYNNATSIQDNSSAFRIGPRVGIETTSWDGIMDEVRVRSGLLSTDWLSTEYQNQNDADAFWGTWSEVASAFIPKIIMF